MTDTLWQALLQVAEAQADVILAGRKLELAITHAQDHHDAALEDVARTMELIRHAAEMELV